MLKTSLKLHEIYALENELNGIRNNKTGEVVAKGLLSQSFSLVTRYWLTDLSKKVGAEKQSIDTLRDELIKKYGKEQDGDIAIPVTIDKVEDGVTIMTEVDGQQVPEKVVNPDFVLFLEEFQELMEQERTIEHHSFKLEDFHKVETDEQYSVLFKILAETQKGAVIEKAEL